MTFDPSTLSNQLSFVRASSLALADGAAVATVADESGNGHGLSFAERPIYRASVAAANGRPAIYFPGLRFCTSAWVNVAAAPYHVWAILAPDLAAGADHGYAWEAVGNPAGFTWVVGDLFGAGSGLYVAGLGGMAGTGPIFDDNAFHLMEGWCDGTNTHLSIDGVDITDNPANGFSGAPGALQWNCNAGVPGYSGYIAEGMARSASPSSGDRANLLAYFAQTFRPSTRLTVALAAVGGAGGSPTTATIGYDGLTSDAAGDTLTVALADDGPTPGTFSPASVSLSPTTPTATSTYTPSAASPGLRSVAATCGQLDAGVGLYSVTGTGTDTIPVTDAGILWSPYNWYPGAGYRLATNPGAYLRTKFGGTSFGLAVDVSAMVAASYAAGDYPTIAWSIDGDAWLSRQLTSSDTTISLASGRSRGAIHTVEVIYQSVNAADLGGLDLWSVPTLALKITGFPVDQGCHLYAPAPRSKNAIIFGDSLGCGVDTLAFGFALGTGFGSLTPAAGHAGLAWSYLLADMLDAEVGICCFIAQGFGGGGLGGAPPVVGSVLSSGAWSQYYSGHSRLTAGLLTPAPDYVVCGHGANESANATATGLVTGIQQWRAAAPDAAIFALVPYGRQSVAGIETGVAAWQLQNPSDPTYLIESRAEGDFGHESGLHFPYVGHLRYAGRAAVLIQQTLGGTVSASSGRYRRGPLGRLR